MNRTELYVMKPSMKDEMETEERKNGNEETYQTYHHRIGNHTLSCITRIEDAAAVGTGRREVDKMHGWRYRPFHDRWSRYDGAVPSHRHTGDEKAKHAGITLWQRSKPIYM